MAKTLTIQIRSAGEALERFRDTFRAVEAGRPATRREGVYFTSIEAARNLLTPNRLALLRAIRTKRPRSIYELAKLVRRDLKNIQDDLRVLEAFGLVQLSSDGGTGRRRAKVPRAPFSQIALRIAI